MGRPTPPFLVHIWDSKNPWPLHNGEPGIDIHLSIEATWNNEHPQKYKVHFVEEVVCKNPSLLWKPWMFKIPFCSGNSWSTCPSVFFLRPCRFLTLPDFLCFFSPNFFRLFSLVWWHVWKCWPTARPSSLWLHGTTRRASMEQAIPLQSKTIQNIH